MAISVEDREAKIGKPAPDFCCTAVDDEEFVEVKLRQVFVGQQKWTVMKDSNGLSRVHGLFIDRDRPL